MSSLPPIRGAALSLLGQKKPYSVVLPTVESKIAEAAPSSIKSNPELLRAFIQGWNACQRNITTSYGKS
jgi:hypothetical protein